MLKKFFQIFIFLLLISFLFEPFSVAATTGRAPENYPKLVNIYLKWMLSQEDVDSLAKWDVLILDIQTQENSPEVIRAIRRKNPNIIILPRFATEEVNSNEESEYMANGSVRNDLLSRLADCWYLNDRGGNRASFWPGTSLLNITDGACQVNGQHWHDYLPQFLRDRVLSSGLWDGIFYDNVWPTISWFNGGNLDINSNGQAVSGSDMDKKWAAGNISLLKKSREVFGDDYLVVANAHVYEPFNTHINGILFENFPPPWESGGVWSGSMSPYVKASGYNQPKMMMINANNANNGSLGMQNYRKMRFSLGSTLLGDGYFSFDFGDQNHGQLWWYDEYDVDLGKAISSPVNILDKNNKNWKSGVWRRDFENGIIVVNSTDENKNYVFTDEAFAKINGSQDRLVNNGSRINMVSLMGRDAVVLLGKAKASQDFSLPPVEAVKLKGESFFSLIKDSSFQNGIFVRAFNNQANQVRDGFFAYGDKYPAGAQVIISDINADGQEETLVNINGTISIYKNNLVLRTFRPYEGKFKGDISMAVADLNGDATKEIVTGAGAGGGPHVRVFDINGRALIGGFFAYDRNFRGGVNVAVIDLNGDDTQEIVTAPGKGGGPQIRIFTKDGRPLTGGFFAYDKDFRGGVSLAVGNVDGQGDKEIVVAPGPGSGPELRIFSKDGRLVKKFYAYDRDMVSGLKVSVSDINNDGRAEILAGNSNYR